MKPILILAATPQETVLLEHALGSTARRKTAAFEYAEGSLGNLPVVVCAGGIGKINAASSTTALIEHCKSLGLKSVYRTPLRVSDGDRD